MSELSNIIALLVEQKRIKNMIRNLAEAIQQYREELNPVRYPLLKNSRFDSWEYDDEDNTIIAIFHENWDGGGSRTVIFPASYLEDNWRACVWAEDQQRRKREAAAETERLASNAAAQKERDLAELKRLQEMYPEAK